MLIVCSKTPHIKASTIERLLLQQQGFRTAQRAFSDFHQQLQKRAKTRVKEAKSTLSNQIFVPLDLPPIPTYNAYSILSDTTDNLPLKTWYDFLPRLSQVDDTAIVPKSKISRAMPPEPMESPIDALLSARQDLATSAPTLVHQAVNMAYNVQGCFKSKDAESAATLTVTSWNINCLTGHKAQLTARLMQQDKCDVLILVDTRHSPNTTRSFKKIFVTNLGAGTQIYFSKDPNRKPGEPGGIIIVIGPKWGTSYAPQHSRTDYSGQGILASVRLSTGSSFINILGTYWPFVPSSAMSANDVSKKLYSRLLAYCRQF